MDGVRMLGVAGMVTAGRGTLVLDPTESLGCSEQGRIWPFPSTSGLL